MNRYHLGAKSGIIAGAISANGVLFAWRNSHASKHQYISSFTAKWRTLTGFPTEQEIQLAVLPVTSFAAANYAGGTDLSDYAGTDGAAVPATNAIKPRAKNTGRPAIELVSCLSAGNVRIASTAALTHGGAPTIATHPWSSDSVLELAAASTVQRGILDIFWEAPSFEAGGGIVDYEGCKKIKSEEGFIITVPIALGATGTGRLHVEVDWFES